MRGIGPSFVRFSLVSLPLAAFVLVAPGSAQSVGTPVIQPIPGSEGMRLNAALGRLAQNPRDVDALIEAGKASLAAGDGEAAIGFYQKADAISPNSARVKAGLAGAYVLTGDPASAVPLFDQADAAGPFEVARLADRGLAFDMVGDPVTAQRYYREALMAGPNDETSRRLALSQAIAGDRRGMEVTLAPLLQRQDKAAWRTRAFALAILGQTDEAESITRSTMPTELAASIANYLRYMPKLTKAQQAAAANLGRFPRAAEIGRDDPRFAQLVRTRPVPVAAAPVQIASAAPSGRKSKREDRRKTRVAESKPALPPVLPAVPPKTAAIAAASPSGELPPLKGQGASPRPAVPISAPTTVTPAARTVPVVSPAATPSQAAVTAVPQRTPAPATGPSLDLEARQQPGFATLANPAPTFELKPNAPVMPTPPVLAAAPAPANPAPKQRTLAEVFADLTPPSREAEPKAGAVDVRKIEPGASPAKPAEVKPAEVKPTEAKAAVAKTVDAKVAVPKKLTPREQAALDKLCAAPDPKTAKGKAAASKAKALPAQCKLAKNGKAKPPVSPSRIWVQVATGRDKKALAFDWRRMTRQEAAVFKGRKGYTSAWGQTTRLLTGPFDSAAQANAFIVQLKKAGSPGAFVWTSPAGQDVDALP